jgi:hypothetical protein
VLLRFVVLFNQLFSNILWCWLSSILQQNNLFHCFQAGMSTLIKRFSID